MGKVLVVDDAAFMRQMLREILEHDGHEVLEAPTGDIALKIYREERPDLVMLDITLPGMDGLTCLKTLRAEYSDARVIMCSALGQQAKVLEAIESGAKDFIVKPAQSDRVQAAVERALS